MPPARAFPRVRELTVLILFWLTALLSFILLVAGVELYTRWLIRRRGAYYVLPPGLRLSLHPDPDVFPRLEKSVLFEVNAEGERGEEVPRSTEGLCRILVTGGSQPEGYLLDQRTTWPGALHRVLQQPQHLSALGAAKVHVGNIARSGVGSEALTLILERVLPRYPRLQAIIILVGASDVLRWLELGAPAGPPPPVRTSEVFRCHPEASFRWSLQGLAITELIRRLRQRWLRPLQVNERTCRWIGKARAMFAQAKEIRNATPDPEPMLEHFEMHLRTAIELAKAKADRVLVVRQPWFDKECTPEEAALMWHGAVGQAWREEVTTFYSLAVLSTLMGLVDKRASRVAKELDVEQVDLKPFLQPGVENYYDFFHATPAGACVIASVVAAALLRKPLGVATAGRSSSSNAEPVERPHSFEDFAADSFQRKVS